MIQAYNYDGYADVIAGQALTSQNRRPQGETNPIHGYDAGVREPLTRGAKRVRLKGLFLSVDPVGFLESEGDPRYFNRYSYTANDPINLIDPDGQKFVIDDKLTDEQQESIRGALKELIETEAGEAAFLELHKSEHTFALTISDSNAFGASNEKNASKSGVGSGGVIGINPTSTDGGSIAVDGSTTRPPAVGLAHEFGHALDSNRGDLIAPHTRFSGRPGTTPNFEKNAVAFEDVVRGQSGLPLRGSYFASRKAQKLACGGRLCPAK